MAKAKEVVEVLSADAEVDAAIAANKLGNLVFLAENMIDMEVDTFKTGFPQLDALINPLNPGMPRKRHIQIFSREPSVGKTSLASQIIASAQRQHMKCGLADAERTITESFLNMLGVVTRKGTDPLLSALRWLRSQEQTLPAEVYLDSISALSSVMDLWVVDSVAALDKAANLAKDSTENNGMGGISKLLSEFFRKNLTQNATVIWLNQGREAIGAYSPSGSAVVKPTGGKAMGFYASLLLEMSRLEALKTGDEIIGMKTQVFLRKNKTGAPDSKTILNYIYGMGFSSEWDYLKMAVEVGAVAKKGSWYSFENWKSQGELEFVKMMRQIPELSNAIMAAVDGEPLAEAIEAVEGGAA